MLTSILFIPTRSDETASLLDVISGANFTARLLLPNTGPANESIMIVPHTGGYNLSTIGCSNMKLPNSVYPSQDQYVERFVVHSLEQFAKKEIVIVGLGSSAALIYDYLLGGKLQMAGNEVLPVPDTTKAQFLKEPFPHFIAAHPSGATLIGISSHYMLRPEHLEYCSTVFPAPKAQKGTEEGDVNAFGILV